MQVASETERNKFRSTDAPERLATRCEQQKWQRAAISKSSKRAMENSTGPRADGFAGPEGCEKRQERGRRSVGMIHNDKAGGDR